MENNNIKEQVAEGNGAQLPMPATPWKATNFWIFDNNELPITTIDSVWFPSRTREATAKRIVACVNGCEGLDNEQVENLAEKVTTLAMNHADVTAQMDELLSALEVAKKAMLKAGINYENAETYNVINEAKMKAKGGQP